MHVKLIGDDVFYINYLEKLNLLRDEFVLLKLFLGKFSSNFHGIFLRDFLSYVNFVFVLILYELERSLIPWLYIRSYMYNMHLSYSLPKLYQFWRWKFYFIQKLGLCISPRHPHHSCLLLVSSKYKNFLGCSIC